MKRILLGLATFALVLGVAAPLGAQANPDRAQEIRDAARARADERRSQKDERIAEIKAEAEARKLQIAQERCDERKARLEASLPRLSNGATTVKGSIDKVYDRVQGFYEKGQLTVDNYTELVDAIELAKADAESSLEALASYQVEVDCEDKGLGGQLDEYRTAVKGVREDLKAYRKSVVALISSLRAEAAQQNGADDSNDDGTGGEQENETESEAEND